MGAKNLWSGLLAAATIFSAGAAQAADRYAIQEHKLTAQDSFTPGEDLTAGDITTNDAQDPDVRFMDKHAEEGARWTSAFLGQDLFPRLSAGTLLAATNDRDQGTYGFENRVDLDLYWLQVRIPSLQTRDSRISSGDAIHLDGLLPWKIDDSQRIGLLLGTDMGIAGGGFHGLRYQLMYGFNAGPLDVQARGGYGLERASNAGSGLPEVPESVGTMPRQAEFLYGAVVGARWAPWGRLEVEANGAQLTDAHAHLLSLAPGIRLSAGERHAAELGAAALIDLNRNPGSNLNLRGIGGLATLGYTFL